MELARDHPVSELLRKVLSPHNEKVNFLVSDGFLNRGSGKGKRSLINLKPHLVVSFDCIVFSIVFIIYSATDMTYTYPIIIIAIALKFHLSNQATITITITFSLFKLKTV